MKKSVLFLIFICICSILVQSVSAQPVQKDSIKLLAVTEAGGGHGVVADLFLEVQPGRGRVFLETFPLTKIATQVSMRFAQQIACSELDIDCSGNDFFYTIEAMPGIVGGPSAGAASAVLAAAVMKGYPIRKDVAITGTINSGGVIGLVGGIDSKITGAIKYNISTVLIPKGSRILKENDRVVDLVEVGKSVNITVIEVATLDEAFGYFTNTAVVRSNESIVLDPKYSFTMKAVALDLCKRNDDLLKMLKELRDRKSRPESDSERASLDFTKKGSDAFNASDFYSSASYCFRSNVMLKREYFALNDYPKEEINKAIDVIKEKIARLDSAVSNSSIETISDLQAFMAVKERLMESMEGLDEAKANPNSKEAANAVAYSEERYYSAVAWAKFFNVEGRRFVMDTKQLKDSCISKVSEAEERYNYVKSFLNADLSQTRKELDSAYSEMNEQDYVMCLFKASKSKAEIDVILSAVGVTQERVREYIDLKLGIAKFALFKAYKKDVFPMIGYSYYEYANSLKNSDPYAALLFAEYALEFSSFDIYFSNPPGILFDVNKESLFAFLTGLFLGILVLVIVFPAHRFSFKKKD
jgi:predicted S18 family serine protease